MKKANKSIWQVRVIALTLLILVYFFAPRYNFLILNSILAYIPLEIGFYIITKQKQSFFSFWLFSFAWLIMIPNSFYLLTDLYYLTSLKIFDSANTNGALKLTESLWRHYAILVGTVFFYVPLATLSVEKVITKIYERLHKVVPKTMLVATFFIINGLALYIGRFMRFHSFELITSPNVILNELAANFQTIEYQVLAYLITICAFIYLVIIKIIKGEK